MNPRCKVKRATTERDPHTDCHFPLFPTFLLLAEMQDKPYTSFDEHFTNIFPRPSNSHSDETRNALQIYANASMSITL